MAWPASSRLERRTIADFQSIYSVVSSAPENGSAIEGELLRARNASEPFWELVNTGCTTAWVYVAQHTHPEGLRSDS
jgi:hypothetical protein